MATATKVFLERSAKSRAVLQSQSLCLIRLKELLLLKQERAMSKRAEAAALKAYPKEEGKVWSSAFGIFEFDKTAPERTAYQHGYEQAEKDTIERAVSWLIKNVDYYIGNMEVSRCLPIKYHVSCACWADLKAFMEKD